jgi:glyceraldehyde-3-phosphate dehydrogenase/erythrose-4-phosphate dehydrogenase
MGKLKEKLLNNLSEEQMEDIFGISAFEYVELMSKYKDDESYPITEAEVEDIEKMVEEYYQSKEFQEYLDTINLDEVFTEHNQNELDEINDSLQVKFTEDEVIEAIKLVKNEEWFITRIRKELNEIWNRKNGVF